MAGTRASICGLAGLLFAQADGATAGAQRPEAEIQTAIRQELDLLRADPDMHGIAIGISLEGGHYRGYGGSLDAAGSGPPDDHTRFEVASVTKTFTGLLVARAVAEGRLTLEAPVSPLLGVDLPALRGVTVRDLISHTSGLPDLLPGLGDPWDTDYDALLSENADVDTLLLSAVAKLPARSSADSAYRYGNAGPVILGLVLSKVYGEPFESLVRDRILVPHGMTESGFPGIDFGSETLAKGYSDRLTRMPHYPGVYRASRGLALTLPDLLRYVDAQLDESDPAIRRSHELMLEHPAPEAFRAWFWLVNRYPDGARRISVHGGGYGTQAWVMFFPEYRSGAVVLVNQSGPNTAGLITDAAKRLLARFTPYQPG